jgi:hypothetical protein
MCSGFASLAMGSSFWHGSHTILGNLADNRFIDVLAFTIHQVRHQEHVVIKKIMKPCSREKVLMCTQKSRCFAPSQVPILGVKNRL